MSPEAYQRKLERRRRWHYQHREEQLSLMKKRYRANRESECARVKRYREANKEAIIRKRERQMWLRQTRNGLYGELAESQMSVVSSAWFRNEEFVFCYKHKRIIDRLDDGQRL